MPSGLFSRSDIDTRATRRMKCILTQLIVLDHFLVLPLCRVIVNGSPFTLISLDALNASVASSADEKET